MIAGILMVLTGCFRNVEAAYKTINWESIVLIAAMLPMSLALRKRFNISHIGDRLGIIRTGCIVGRYFTLQLR